MSDLNVIAPTVLVKLVPLGDAGRHFHGILFEVIASSAETAIQQVRSCVVFSDPTVWKVEYARPGIIK